MKNNITELVFILDRSGSMSGFEADTIGGFNATIEKQKEQEGKVYVSTVLFDNYSEVIHDRVDIGEIKPMTGKDYTVGGCTALLDAIGGAIHHIGNIHKYARSEDVPEHTIFIITTDGMENASHCYSSQDIKAKIKRQTEKYGWEFIFLAANIDAVETAERIGIRRERAANYRQTNKGVERSYYAMSEAITTVRNCCADEMDLEKYLKEDVEVKRKEIIKKQIKDVMIGHAIGDALGVPVEFCDRSELDDKPVRDMTGFGTFPVPAGAWSDDTSMSLAALDSLANGMVDFDDIMGNFGEWLEHDAYTSTGETFDEGRTCVHAIVNYFARNMSVVECGMNKECSNGNGSLMRIHPFALYAYTKELARFEWGKLIAQASALTHAHERSVVGCLIYTFVLFQILNNPKKDSIRLGLRYAERDLRDFTEITHYRRLFESTFPSLSRDAIKSTGYVVDTLEAALWCLLTTDNYRDCVLKAVNLGDDTDTVAAVAGGLAGALYGLESIPKEWLAVLKRRDYIESICEKAAESWLTHAET